MLPVDANTFFGIDPGLKADYGLATLLQLMESHGIAGALTLSLRGLHDDHHAGNAETLAACRANPRLIPVATINPERGMGLEEDIAQIKAGGFRAIRLFPGEAWQRWSPFNLAFQRVFDRLVPLGLPIIAPVENRDAIAPLARATAEAGLPILFVGTSYATQSEVEAVAHRYPHVHVETSRLATPDAITLLAREIGADRILYGSSTPLFSPQPSMNMIFRADLTAEERSLILSGNAVRLFHLAEATMLPQDEEARFRSYDGPKIDVHAHLLLGHYRFPSKSGPHVVLDHCRRFSLERVIASSALGIFYDMEAGNREMKEIIDAHPGFRGYVVTNPNYLELSCAQMEHYLQFDNFVGVKIHCEYSQTPTDSDKLRALFAEIARHGRPVLIHNMGSEFAEALRDLALTYPHMPIILAHGRGDGITFGLSRIVADAPNIYLEFCTTAPTRSLLADALATIGPERLLFGTDQDLHDPGFGLGMYYDAGLTPEQEVKIMYRNAKRLFDL